MTLETIGHIIGEFVPQDKFPEELDTLLHTMQMSYFYRNIDNDAIVFPFIRHMGVDNATMPLTINTVGIASLPHDFAAHRAMTVMYGNEQRLVEVVDASEWRYRLHLAIETPTREYPIASYQGKAIKFAPKNIQAVNYTYLANPVPPVYATQLVGTNLRYDPANSVELMWLDNDQIEIVKMTIEALGTQVTTDQVKEKLTQQQQKQ